MADCSHKACTRNHYLAFPGVGDKYPPPLLPPYPFLRVPVTDDASRSIKGVSFIFKVTLENMD